MSARHVFLRDALWGVAILFGLLLWTFVLRAPFSSNVGADEAFFAVVGRDWSLGLLPYAERFDVKAPGLFLLYALATPLLGSGLIAIKGLEIAFVAASSYGLWRIGRDFFSARVGAAAALLYPIYSLAMSGVNAPAALFLSGFEIFAVHAALGASRDRSRREIFLSGLLFGCAFTIKQTAAFEAGTVFFAVAASAPDWRARWRGLAAFGLGCALAPLGFALYFFVHGAFGALWQGAVVAAGGRLGGDNVSFVEGLVRFPGGLRPMLAPSVCAALVMLRFRQWENLPLAAPLRLILAWLCGALLAVVAMRAMYDHYFLPLAPPLLLIAAVAVFHLLDFGSPQRARAATALFGLAAMLSPALFGFEALRSEGEDRAGVVAAGRAAVAAGLKPGDTALVVNRGLMFYVDNDAAPPGRLFHPQHLLCDFPLLQGDLLADALARRPRFVVLADVRLGMVCEKPERLRAAQDFLARDYVLVGHVAGDWDSFDIYRSLDNRAGLDLGLRPTQ